MGIRILRDTGSNRQGLASNIRLSNICRTLNETRKQLRRHYIAGSTRIARTKHPPLLIIVNQRTGKPKELAMPAHEILLMVIRSGNHLSATPWTFIRTPCLLNVAGPQAMGTFHPAPRARQQLVARRREINRSVQFQTAPTQPIIKKPSLHLAAGKTIKHPSSRMTGKPFLQKTAHQVIRQVFPTVEDGLRDSTQCRPFTDMLAQQRASAEVVQLERSCQNTPLRAFAGRRRA